jgi:hypothetical protein
MEGLDFQLITVGNEDKSNESADSSLHHEDDQQGIFSSESEDEDEDVIPPTPPPVKRKRRNQSLKSLSSTKSKVFFYGKTRNSTLQSILIFIL